jgi:hypothetical protein
MRKSVSAVAARLPARSAMPKPVTHFGPAFMHDRYRHTVGVSFLEDFFDLLAKFVDGSSRFRLFVLTSGVIRGETIASE